MEQSVQQVVALLRDAAGAPAGHALIDYTRMQGLAELVVAGLLLGIVGVIVIPLVWAYKAIDESVVFYLVLEALLLLAVIILVSYGIPDLFAPEGVVVHRLLELR